MMSKETKGMLHVEKGLFFKGNADGSVRIVKMFSDKSDEKKIDLDITIDADQWCSVMNEASQKTINGTNHQKAKDFHTKK